MTGPLLLTVLLFASSIEALTPLTGSIRLSAKPWLCLNAQSGLLNPGDLIQLYTCSNAINEVWTFGTDGMIHVAANTSLCINAQQYLISGQPLELVLCSQGTPLYQHYPDGTIRAEGYGWCWNSRGTGLNQGDVVQLYNCQGTANEIFFVQPDNVQGEFINDASTAPGNTQTCLDAQSGALQTGNLIQLFPCSGGANQNWVLYSDQTIRVASKPSLCFNIQTVVEAGQQIQLYPCSAASNEIWEKRADGTIRSSYDTDLCITAPGAPTQWGVPVNVNLCNSPPTQTQIFGFIGEDAPSGSIRPNAATSLCFNSAGGNLQPGNLIQLYACNGASNEMYTINADATIRVASNQNLCLEDQGGALQSGDTIQLNLCNNGPGQKFVKEIDGTIRALNNLNLCMDARGGTLTSGTVIQLFTCSVGYNQRFYVSPV